MAGQEKTEKATPKKRQDERKKGNVFQSKDIITVCTIGIAFYILKFWAPFIYKITGDMMIKYISLMQTTYIVDEVVAGHIIRDLAFGILGSAGVLMVAVIAVSIIVSGIQTRFIVSKDSMKFKFSKLNPLKGLQKMVSMRSLIELLKNIIKISILLYVIYSVVTKDFNQIPKLMMLDLKGSITYIFESIMSMVYNIIIAFTAISAVDFIYQKWDYEKNIKMSKQEIKEEYKQTEGDPQLKGKIKEKQRAMSMSRMMQQVPNADVIIRNPTHFAIAIKYDIEKNNAPIVLAKGQDNVAMKIIEKAMESNIQIVENRPLARALYKAAEINMEIPLEYYEPIAEILAWVYKLREKGN